MPLTVNTRQTTDGVSVVEPMGEFEVYTAALVKEALAPLTSEHRCRVCLSLDGVTFLDSKGIGTIVEGTKQARRQGGELVVICSSERFRRHIRILKLDTFLTLASSEEVALRTLAPQEAGDAPQ